MLAGHTNDVLSCLNGFDIFALPSLAEGMSNALLEAMSSGVPCVASQVGGNPELIEHGSSGLLFKAGDVEALTDHLTSLASDAIRRRAIGLSGRKRIVENFALQRMLEQYSELYRDAFHHRHPRKALPTTSVNRSLVRGNVAENTFSAIGSE